MSHLWFKNEKTFFFSWSRHERRPSFFLRDEFQCLGYAVLLADRAQMESATNESIKKRSIPSNKKLILEARGKIAVVSPLKEVKNIVQTFSFQRSLYAHEDRAYSLWSTQQILSHFPIDFRPTSKSPPISHVPKKSKLKAQHGVKVRTEVWEKELWMLHFCSRMMEYNPPPSIQLYNYNAYYQCKRMQ